MHIRKANSADADTIYRFICALEEKQMGREGFDACYRHNITSSHNHYLLAEEKGEAIGFLSCQGQMLLHHAAWVYEIQELYVEDAWRSKGVGRQLLEALDAILSNVEYDVLEVSSNKRRTKAHGFYLQNGFEQTHLKFIRRGNQNV
jgi:PhnO protein